MRSCREPAGRAWVAVWRATRKGTLEIVGRESHDEPHPARGLVPLLVGLTWVGPPNQRRPDQPGDRGSSPRRAEVVLAVVVTIVGLVVVPVVGWVLTRSVVGVLLGLVVALPVSGLVLVVATALLRRFRAPGR